jgi:hypothetical protein
MKAGDFGCSLLLVVVVFSAAVLVNAQDPGVCANTAHDCTVNCSGHPCDVVISDGPDSTHVGMTVNGTAA